MELLNILVVKISFTSHLELSTLGFNGVIGDVQISLVRAKALPNTACTPQGRRARFQALCVAGSWFRQNGVISSHLLVEPVETTSG
jgi:hypothetical protein